MATTTSFTQNFKTIQSEILEIDSLLVYNQFEKAEKRIDSLQSLIKDSNFEKEKIKLLLNKAKTALEINENPQALSLFLEVLSTAERQKLYDLACEANIYISLIHEINGDLFFAYNYIMEARRQSDKYKITHLKSTILIRLASIHRIVARNNDNENTQFKELKKTGFVASLDSTMSLAKQAVVIAQNYQTNRDLVDSYFLIGTCHHYQGNTKRSIEYYLKEIPIKRKIRDFRGVLFTFANVSKSYLNLNQPKNALIYIDSAFNYYDRVVSSGKHTIASLKAEVFNELNEPDSAYFYANFALEELEKSDDLERKTIIRKLEEQFQNDKKEATIQNKNRQIVLISILALVLLGAAISYILKNREIEAQAKIIEKQVSELHKSVEQKEILLSELQHRVKNNLQYVISLLDIQKESIGSSSLEDLVRNNKNRIHSIALLHKKLELHESVDRVAIGRYIEELSSLIKESFENNKQDINIATFCNVAFMPISKALPLGLIIVELLSNSLKHAFVGQKKGEIKIEFTQNENNYLLKFADNGVGFDFENSDSKGLGLEITKGLIDQLDGNYSTNMKNGFNLSLYF